MKFNNLVKTMAICSAILMSFASCGSELKNSATESSKTIYKNDSVNYTEQDTETDNGENINTEEYNHTDENSYKNVSENPLSTFSVDVDTASYTNVRRMINNGEQINPDAVRTEEFINYFKYNYEQPNNDDSVSITTEFSDCPWNNDAKLMLVGLQAKEIETKDINSNIVFLIDVSGSMNDENKLPLVQQAFSMLAKNLNENDRVSIVTYAGSDKVVLDGEKGNNTNKIKNALNSLEAGGSTAGEMGINRAYELAEKYFIEGGNNRVILATDGDLNVGISSESELKQLITKKRESGIFLSVLGFGEGNYKDNKLETIADSGNGNYSYIDNLDEAERVLVSEMNGTLYNVAKDTKIQVEFNPSNVKSYRLVGYENRILDDNDFEDDSKDAGDMGSGQQVTALYEIIPSDNSELSQSKKLKYSDNSSINENNTKSDEILTVSVRYKNTESNKSRLIEQAVKKDSYKKTTPANLKFASSVAEFSMLLKNSEYVSGKITVEDILEQIPDGFKGSDEFSSLVRKYSKTDSSSLE